MSRHGKTWGVLLVALILLILALNFLNFRVARSVTEVNHTLSTYRAGETLPASMGPNSELYVTVRGDDRLAAALQDALREELEARLPVGSVVTAGEQERNGRAPLLLVDLAPERLWTPFYGRATVTAQLYFAYDGDAPWALDEPVVFTVSPAVKADGEFTLVDGTWGLVSAPAYRQYLAQALAQDIAAALQNDVYKDAARAQ